MALDPEMLNSQLPLHQSLPLGVEKYPRATGNPRAMPLAAVPMRAVEKVRGPTPSPNLKTSHTQTCHRVELGGGGGVLQNPLACRLRNIMINFLSAAHTPTSS